MKPGFWLCSSFFFSSWGDRMWNFSVGLYLVKLTPGSLQLTAIYGMVVTGAVILFLPIIGNWIDRNNRLKVIRTLLLMQNSLIICSALFIGLILFRITTNANFLMLFKVMIILFGAAANLASQGEQISITKDWVVVISRGNTDNLAILNAQLRRIDLTVAILAPIAVGSLMSLISELAGILLICIWNILSMVSEYLQLHHIYKCVTELSDKQMNHDRLLVEPCSSEDTNVCQSQRNLLDSIKYSLTGWGVYKKQNVFLAGVALAVLYLTVLGFSTITVGYAYSQSLREVYVSVFFGTGAVCGILGTLVFPFIRHRVGLVKTGLFGFAFQCSMLLFCVASIWSPGSPSSLKHPSRYFTGSVNSTIINGYLLSNSNSTTIQSTTVNRQSFTSIILLMVGVVLSRSGLWISDLTITQLQQENIPEQERGVVGGVQSSFNSILDLLQYVLTVILSRPEDFGVLILVSFSAVLTGLIIYSIFCSLCTLKAKNNITGNFE